MSNYSLNNLCYIVVHGIHIGMNMTNRKDTVDHKKAASRKTVSSKKSASGVKKPPDTNNRNDMVKFRATSTEREMIRAAASILRITESDYVRNSALTRAEMDLGDQKIFRLPADKLEAFAKILDRPVRAKQRLRELLKDHMHE